MANARAQQRARSNNSNNASYCCAHAARNNRGMNALTGASMAPSFCGTGAPDENEGGEGGSDKVMVGH